LSLSHVATSETHSTASRINKFYNKVFALQTIHSLKADWSTLKDNTAGKEFKQLNMSSTQKQ